MKLFSKENVRKVIKQYQIFNQGRCPVCLNFNLEYNELHFNDNIELKDFDCLDCKNNGVEQYVDKQYVTSYSIVPVKE